MSSPSAVTSALATQLPHSTGPEATETSTTKNIRTTPLRFRHPDYTDSPSIPSAKSKTGVEEDEGASSGDNEYSDEETEGGDTTAVEDNYVRRVLAKEKPLPPITIKNWYKELNIVSTLALTIVPGLAIYGALTVPIQWRTALWAVIYYYYTGLGITAGYHRLWSHRAYTASKPLQYFLALGGSGAVEGSIKWWSRGHRAHHRYTDTDLDPYSAHKGFIWSHIGWMVVKPRRKPGVADVSDLNRNPVVQWQHRWYLPLIIGMGFVFPTVVAGLGWNDWKGGFYFAGAARLLFVHHSTFCVNSLAHWLGEQPFDSKHTPRDHVVTALATIGEGYHNFHHEFPQDFRNAIKWFQYDPTKWFIYTCYKLGLASQLKTFPDNEVKRGQVAMQLQRIQEIAKSVEWPLTSNHLPVLTWDQFKAECDKGRKLIVIGGFIHDVETFIPEHPGGMALVKTRVGKDATTAFYGGFYDHSNSANNLLSSLRVGCIEGGYEVESMKNYSDIIENLLLHGSDGVSSKGSDLDGASKRTVPLKGVATDTVTLPDLKYDPRFGGKVRMNGGVQKF